MKNLVIFLLFFAACSTDPHEAAIIAYEETVGDTRYNLKTKITNIEELTPVTARDSAEVLRAELHRQDSLSEETASFLRRTGVLQNYQEPRQLVELRQRANEQLEVYDAAPDSVLLRRFQATVKQQEGVEKEFTRVYRFQGMTLVSVE